MQVFRRNSASHWLCIGLIVASGCSRARDFRLTNTWESTPSYHQSYATSIEFPNVGSNLRPEVAESPEPLSLENPSEIPTREVTLDEAIRIGLERGEVLRSLGGSLVQNMQFVRTGFDPAITESNPQGGVEAALSAFDAQVSSQLFWQKNDRPNNIAINPIVEQFQVFTFQETRANFDYAISKRTATGASFTARHNVLYDRPNTPNRLFRSAYAGAFEAEYRQPLMQGAGVDFNRIAGPNSPIGQYNGVLIARINTDISLAEFELGVTMHINDIETAYWELFFAYHNLEAQVAGRNSALITWQRIKELEKVGAEGSDAASEAQARSQYYLFDVEVKEALSGPNGLYAAEQQLRYLMGLPANDGTLLKPVSEPMEGQVVFDWSSALRDALTQRVEIRRSKWSIKRRELELIAARMNRRPTLDFLGQYRYRGLGDALINSYDPDNEFDNFYQSVFTGDYQEWQAGLELTYPVGLRRAATAVSNARWNLAREQAVLDEQQLKISHDLSNAARRIQRAYALMETNYNRQQSDKEQVNALIGRYEAGLDNINFLLQAQQQLAASQSAYFRSLVDYQLALRDFHREKGSLLNYNQVNLAEGAWAPGAYRDAAERGRFFAPRRNPERVDTPDAISRGVFDPTQVGATGPLPPPTAAEEIPADAADAVE